LSDPRVALVTGAASGIGAAAARAFAMHGDRLVLVDLDADALGALEAELTADTLAVAADVSDPAAMDAVAEQATTRFGTLDVVFANAGIAFPERPITETPPDVVERLLHVNVIGAVNTLRSCVPLVPDGGAIVLTSSISGQIAHPGAAVYGATKIALIGLARSLASELSPRRIRVNCVCPGGVDTPLVTAVMGDERDADIAEYAKVNPLGRIATPDDVAEVVLFLAGAAHVNGVALRVDGGDALLGAI
jgi:NAD(P)-dependent dehydrogenase (short-subunit alcohol dehydrogenase family)